MAKSLGDGRLTARAVKAAFGRTALGL